MTTSTAPQANTDEIPDATHILMFALQAALREGRIVSLSQMRDADGHDVLTIVLRPGESE